MTELVTKVVVVGDTGDELVVNADGSVDSGTGSSPTAGGTPGVRKVIVVGATGNELAVNSDGSVNAA